MIPRSKKVGLRNRAQHYFWIHVRPQLQQFRWFIILGFAVLAFVLGYSGFDKSYRAAGEPQSVLDLIYLSLQLFLLESGSIVPSASVELEIARFFAPAVTVSTLLIFLLMLFYDQFKLFYLRMCVKDHAVICGLGLLGQVLVRHFLALNYPVIVIERETGKEDVARCRNYGAVILAGDATHPYMLQKAQVRKARYLISVLGTDGQNAEVAGHAAERVRARKGSLACFVHVVNPEICAFLKSKELRDAAADGFRCEFINIYRSAGRAILRDYPPFPTDVSQVPQVHLLVIGIGGMGESLIAHAVKKWRDSYGSSGKRLKISIIDREADTKKEMLRIRYPALTRYCDLVPIQMEIPSPAFLTGEYLVDASDHTAITAVYICLGDEAHGLSTALTINQHSRQTTVPIIVRTNNDRGIATLFKEWGPGRKSGEFRNIHAFPLVGEATSMDFILNSTHERIAQAIHEEYVEQQRNAGQTPKTNPSMAEWFALPEDLKESNRKQADSIIEKLQAIHCDIDLLTDWDEELFEFQPEEVEKLAIMEHERWMKEKIELGWKYGQQRNNENKIHNCLIPWDDLPEEEKEKDRNAVRLYPSILSRIDLKIIRLEDGYV